MSPLFWADAFLRVLAIFLFYPTRQHAYRVAVLAAIIGVTLSIYLTSAEVTAPPIMTYSLGSRTAFCFGFIAYLLFAEGTFPDHLRRTRDQTHAAAGVGGLDERPSNFPLTKKLWWMVDLSQSFRMIGWVQEPRGCYPPNPPPSRRTFLWKTFFKLIANVVITDFAVSFLALSPAFDNRVHDPTDGPETYLTAVPFLRRVPYVLSFGIVAGTSISAIHNFTSLMFVGIGHSSPTLWPDLWGRWGDAYTVRKLWGQTWHQLQRPTLGGLGKLVANKLLKFRRGTNRSSYAQLYVAFFLSGLFHSAGEFVLMKGLAYPAIKFFPLQAVAITFEDLVIYIAKDLLRRWGFEPKPGKTGESWAGASWRAIGYCWVTLWFCLALPVWLDELNVVGICSFDRGPISQFLLGGWKQWSWYIDT